MKANLMFRDKDFVITKKYPFGSDHLLADLELERILEHMALKDEMIYVTCKEAILNPLFQIEEVIYRQDNLMDALDHPNVIKMLYEITVETEKQRKSSWRWFSMNYLSSTFSSAVELLDIYIEMLLKLRLVADNNIENFHSEGFRNLLIMLQNELSDEYFKTAKSQLEDLKHSDGTFISSKIGSYLQGIHYVLRQREKKGSWRRWLFAPSYTIAPRDDSGAKDIAKRRERAINEATNALAQATEHLEGFFNMLRCELSFYVGCINLADAVKSYEMPISIPTPFESENKNRMMKDLYDLSLLLLNKSKVTANEMCSNEKSLYIITGANQGGKSTFLRSVGQAQLMAQCGMFVCAMSYEFPIRKGIYTHFKKEEDKAFLSGKLDEELSRMSEIVDHLAENSLLLLNESFAATNEREGSEINGQITRALIENGIEVFAVTHLQAYASAFTQSNLVHFLRAQRLDDGTRTFKMVEGEPLSTAFGEDLYREIFIK